MSGRNNHFVPQFLQRGFGVKTKKETQVFVHSKDKAPFRTSTRNFGAQRDFYIDGDDTSVDDDITNFELEFFLDLVTKLRDNKDASIYSSSDFAQVLSHVHNRTKSIRTEIENVPQVFFSNFSDHKNAGPNWKKVIEQNRLDIINTAIDELQLSDADKILVREYSVANPDFLGLEGDLFDEISTQMNALNKQLPEVTKRAHFKLINSNLTDQKMYECIEKMNFRILEFRTEKLILGDTMIAFLDGQSTSSPFFSAIKKISEIYFPISSGVLLHGYSGVPTERKVSTINNILASCSYNYFLSESNLSEHGKLKKRIGKNAQLLRPGEQRHIKFL